MGGHGGPNAGLQLSQNSQIQQQQHQQHQGLAHNQLAGQVSPRYSLSQHEILSCRDPLYSMET